MELNPDNSGDSKPLASEVLYNLNIVASPDSGYWKERHTKEMKLLDRYRITLNNTHRGSLLHITQRKDSLNYSGQFCLFSSNVKHQYFFRLRLPDEYPQQPPEIFVDVLDNVAIRMTSDGRIIFSDSFLDDWTSHTGHYGIAHAVCLGLGPWLAREVPELIESGLVQPPDLGIRTLLVKGNLLNDARLNEENLALDECRLNPKTDFFEIFPDQDGPELAGRCCYVYNTLKTYVFELQITIPLRYPFKSPAFKIPKLEGKTPNIDPGGQIVLDMNWNNQWGRHAPDYGLAHAISLGLGQWLRREIPKMVYEEKLPSPNYRLPSFELIRSLSDVEFKRRAKQEFRALFDLNLADSNPWFIVNLFVKEDTYTCLDIEAKFRHNAIRYAIKFRMHLPVNYPYEPPVLLIPELRGNMPDVRPGGRIPYSDGFRERWSPSFGFVHAMCLGFGPWLVVNHQHLTYGGILKPLTDE